MHVTKLTKRVSGRERESTIGLKCLLRSMLGNCVTIHIEKHTFTVLDIFVPWNVFEILLVLALLHHQIDPFHIVSIALHCSLNALSTILWKRWDLMMPPFLFEQTVRNISCVTVVVHAKHLSTCTLGSKKARQPATRLLNFGKEMQVGSG